MEELKKENEAKKVQIEQEIKKNKENVYHLKRQTIEDLETIKKNTANDFTNLKNSIQY